jgi:hypothetical protein
MTGSRIGGMRACKTRRAWIQQEQTANMQRGIKDQTEIKILVSRTK